MGKLWIVTVAGLFVGLMDLRAVKWSAFRRHRDEISAVLDVAHPSEKRDMDLGQGGVKVGSCVF